MGTIADKLLYLSGTKDAIKAAIESMGQSVSSSATFRSFADLIKNISKDATATAANILSGKTAYVGGAKVTGTMANNGTKTAYIENNGESVTLSKGYYSGGSITADITNLTAANIKSGVTVGGVAGTFTSDAKATAADIASGKTAYVNGEKITGTLVSGFSKYVYAGTTGSSSYTCNENPKIVIVHSANQTSSGSWSATNFLKVWFANSDYTSYTAVHDPQLSGLALTYTKSTKKLKVTSHTGEDLSIVGYIYYIY